MLISMLVGCFFRSKVPVLRRILLISEALLHGSRGKSYKVDYRPIATDPSTKKRYALNLTRAMPYVSQVGWKSRFSRNTLYPWIHANSSCPVATFSILLHSLWSFGTGFLMYSVMETTRLIDSYHITMDPTLPPYDYVCFNPSTFPFGVICKVHCKSA